MAIGNVDFLPPHTHTHVLNPEMHIVFDTSEER